MSKTDSIIKLFFPNILLIAIEAQHNNKTAHG